MTHSLAVLDDYAGVADKHFANVPGVKYTSFPETLSPSTPAGLAALTDRLSPFSMISTMRERTAMPAALLSQLPNLRLILTTGVRNASIDLAYCREHSVVVSGTKGTRPLYYDADGHPIHTPASRPSTPPNTASRLPGLPPGYSSTTQHALSLLLSLTSRICIDDALLKSDPTAWQSGLTVPLGGKTLGIVGLGKLGAAFARMCILALDMRVIAWSSNLTQSRADEIAESLGLAAGSFASVSKQALFESSNVVSVHYVLSDRSRGIVGVDEINSMKRSAVLVNTARGPIIDEDALFAALTQGKIAGAALDVYWGAEPLEQDSRWRREPWGRDGRAEVVLSPHMGYVNDVTMETWYAEQAADVERFMSGKEVALKLT